MQKITFICVLIAFFCSGCVPERTYPVEPEIRFIDISPSRVRENTDTIRIKFGFTDGDGDLGLDPADATRNDVQLTIKRLGYPPVSDIARLPNITPKGKNKAIVGEVQLTVQTAFLMAGIREDTALLSYDISILDRANHRSNTISTSTIVVKKP